MVEHLDGLSFLDIQDNSQCSSIIDSGISSPSFPPSLSLVLCACSAQDNNATPSPDEQGQESKNTTTPTKQSTVTPTYTPVYYLGASDFSINIHTRPGDLPPGDYLIYLLVNTEGSEGIYRYAYASFDGEVSGSLFDLIAPEGGSYSLVSYFPNSEDLKQYLGFEYDQRFATDSGLLFINLEEETIRQLTSGCANGLYSLPNLVTPYALFVCDNTLYLISLETWEIEPIAFSEPYPGRGFWIDWISPDLVWFGSDEWRFLDLEYAYCTLRISSRHFQCHRDLPSYAYKIILISQEGPGEKIVAYYENMEGDVYGVSLFPTDYLENPRMAMSQPENLPSYGWSQWVPDSNMLFSIRDEYPYRSVATYRSYDLNQGKMIELGSIPENMVPHMITTDRMGFWSPDGLHYILKFEMWYGDELIEEVWQISVVTGEMEQLAPGIHNIRDVIGYFQVP